jgi:hypothetical protein
VGEVDYQEGGDGEEAELVDADGETEEEGDEEKPPWGMIE